MNKPQPANLPASVHQRLLNLSQATGIDVGFGDALVPASVSASYPTLLDFPPPRVRIYPRESVVAEKVHAMVALNMTNTRMKDFFDVWILAWLFPFDGKTLVRAMRATFERRQTLLPRGGPMAFMAEFSESPEKIRQWQAFVRRNRLDADNIGLSRVVAELMSFLVPPLEAAGDGVPFSATWEPGGPWIRS